MKTIATNAIVLTRVAYGEADRIMTMLTNDHGKISVLAKGVRKPKSKLAGGIELLSVGHITYIDGRSELKTLVSAQLKEHFSNITANISRTMFAYDVLKHVHLYTEPDCESDYFELVQQALTALNNTAIPLDITSVWYCVQLLQLSGHGINVESDASGNKLQATDSFGFDYHEMAFMPATSGDLTSNHIKFIRLAAMLQPKDLHKIKEGTELAEQLQEVALQCLKYYSR